MSIPIETEILLRLSLMVDESHGMEGMFRRFSHQTLQLLGGIASVVLECRDADLDVDPGTPPTCFSMPRSYDDTLEFREFMGRWVRRGEPECPPPGARGLQVIRASGLTFVVFDLPEFGHWVLVFAAEIPRGAFLRELAPIARRLASAARSIRREQDLRRADTLERIYRRLAMTFLRVGGGRLRDKIMGGLGEMGRYVEVDRTYVFQYDLEAQTASNIYEWCASGIEPQIEHLQDLPMALFPEWMEHHTRGENMVIPDVLALDPADPLRGTLGAQGIKSLLAIPMMKGKEPWGFVGFDSVRSHTRWTPTDAALLGVFAQLLLNALLREERAMKIRRVQRAVEESAAESKRLAEEATRLLEARTRFISTVSHEIRTPLTGVLGMVELLATTELTDRQRDFVEALDRSGRLLKSTVDHLLDAARLEAGKVVLEVAPVSPRVLVADVASIYGAMAQEKGLELGTQVADSVPPVVWGDEVRLKQALGNLVSNAIKFTEAGRVTIRSEYRPGRDGEDGHLILGVRDTGIGFDKSQAKRITEEFWQARQSGTVTRGIREGSGLGLAIVQELSRLMGGELHIASEMGVGSDLWLKLPLPVRRPSAGKAARGGAGSGADVVGAPAGGGEDAGDGGLAGAPVAPGDDAGAGAVPVDSGATGAPGALSTLQGLRILVVDDYPTGRAVLLGQLRHLGALGTPASDGVEALVALDAHRFDAVVLDCHMPRMDGFQVLRVLRRWKQEGRPVPPVVAISADSSTEVEARAARSGAIRFLQKPYRLADLRAALREAIWKDGGQPLMPPPAVVDPTTGD